MEKNTVLLQDTEAFMHGELDNVTVQQNCVVLDLVQGGYVPYGCYTSAPIPMPLFDALRVSWNAASPEDTAVEAQVRVMVDGKDVARLRRGKVPFLRRQMGIIFQDFRLIPSMTVYENIAFAMHVTNIGRKQIKERVGYMLELVHLEDKAKVYPEFLSGGEQQMLAVGRALLSRPQLMMMDEPSLGLAPLIIKDIFNIIQEINKQGVTILLVEQNAKKALSIANRAYVLETGRIVKENDAQALLHDEAIKKAYLGE